MYFVAFSLSYHDDLSKSIFLFVFGTGKLFDVTQDYITSCYVAGGVFIVSSILHCMDNLLVAYERRQERTKQNSTPGSVSMSSGLKRDSSAISITASAEPERKTSVVRFSMSPEPEIIVSASP